MLHSMIEINGLVKKYGDRVAVNGVSFCVQDGETFGLLGPDGAGKTRTRSDSWLSTRTGGRRRQPSSGNWMKWTPFRWKQPGKASP
ncbi:ABC-2 type transport system ATP-binding protein [Candidatus Hakubella thermalkaliphila]|uniref:ABC-2 type transport system ATP-binding protein n=1 Tax=Candidatus Hakubella thermalkaliphila TaxID=2754717 RepID=A0A6V8PJK8_9ACTN|nr:ABC-2 type transport system ATP-binding protein [Candidatus Hakubella thermalkaliphila]